MVLQSVYVSTVRRRYCEQKHIIARRAPAKRFHSLMMMVAGWLQRRAA